MFRRQLLLVLLPAFVLFAHAQGTAPAAGALYVVTHVDVVPSSAADAGKLLAQFALDSRKDPGAVRVEVMRDVARLNHFEIVEVWQTRQAFDGHVALEHTRTFREKIQPMLGSPFDERLYGLLQ